MILPFAARIFFMALFAVLTVATIMNSSDIGVVSFGGALIFMLLTEPQND